MPSRGFPIISLLLAHTLPSGAELIVRIDHNLSDGKHAPRLECPKALRQHGSPVGNLTEGFAQNHHITACLGNMGLSGIPMNGFEIADISLNCPQGESVEHALLNVNSDDLGPRQHLLGCWKEKPPRSGTDLQHSLSGPQSDAFEGRRRSKKFLKNGILQDPCKASGTRQRPLPASPSPAETDHDSKR